MDKCCKICDSKIIHKQYVYPKYCKSCAIKVEKEQRRGLA